MWTMSDSLFPHQFVRNVNHVPEWTPQSAVSSFNFPLKYDSTLTTPVSINADSPTVEPKRPQHKTWIEHNQICYSPRDSRSPFSSTQSPMKSKGSSLALSVSDADMTLSISPYVFDSPQACPPTPYWGSFGVSAHHESATTSPSINSNPTPQASTTPTYNQAPILSAPNPNQLKRNHEITPIQKQQPFQPVPTQPLLLSQKILLSPTESLISIDEHEIDTSSTAHPLKRQRSPSPPSEDPQPPPVVNATPSPFKISRSGATLSVSLLEESTDEEKLLLKLRDEHVPYLDWKATTAKFNELTAKHHNTPALQMRHFRHKERLRVWTDEEIRALRVSKISYDKIKWETISQQMLRNGCPERWSPRACQLKYAELYPDEYDASPELTLTDEASIAILLHTDDGPKKTKRRRTTGGATPKARGGRGSVSAKSATGEYSGQYGGPPWSGSGDTRKREYEQQHAWKILPQPGRQHLGGQQL